MRSADADMTDNRKLVYISQPYGGKPENYDRAQKTLLTLNEFYPQYEFISPIVAYGFAYNTYSYEVGMRMCITLLAHCDEIWICNDNGESKGVKIEREWAQKNGMPIREDGCVD